MLSKIALSFVGGIILLYVLVIIGVNINSNVLGISQQKTVTVLHNGGLIDVVDGNCTQIPQPYRQYCNNVSVKRYGLFLKLESIKDVPDNPYIQNLKRAEYFPCAVGSLNGCTVDDVVASDRIEPDLSDRIIVISEVVTGVISCSYAVYFLGNKFLWDNKV